jgi:hypothetical protein
MVDQVATSPNASRLLDLISGDPEDRSAIHHPRRNDAGL